MVLLTTSITLTRKIFPHFSINDGIQFCDLLALLIGKAYNLSYEKTEEIIELVSNEDIRNVSDIFKIIEQHQPSPTDKLLSGIAVQCMKELPEEDRQMCTKACMKQISETGGVSDDLIREIIDLHMKRMDEGKVIIK